MNNINSGHHSQNEVLAVEELIDRGLFAMVTYISYKCRFLGR